MKRYARVVAQDGRILSGWLQPDDQLAPLPNGLAEPNASPGAPLPIARLLAPVEPPNIFAIGRNYQKHAAERGEQAPESPLVFLKPTSAVIGPDAAVVLPVAAPEQVDFEAELAIVIGRTARNVSEADALRYVFGYTCANDITARDCQDRDKQWARAKGFDTFCPLGPWIVPAGEFDPDNRRIQSRLNGRTMQDATTNAMIFSCAALVSYLSRQFTLHPGTLILTGTPEGIGAARTPPVFLRPGDRIEVEIEGLGILSNPIHPPA